MVNTVVDDTSAVHACAVPVSDEHLWEVTAAFVAEGLAAGERVVYFEDESADAVLERLADDRVPVREELARGGLAIVPTDTTRAALRSPVAQVEEMLHAAIDESLAHGFAGFRMTAQTSYGIGRVGGVGLPEYDAGLDRVLRARPEARALCLYDRRRFPDDLVAEMRTRHSREITEQAVYDDGLLRVTRVAAYRLRLAGEIDHSNRPLLPRLLETALDEAMRSDTGSPDITLDLASLRFLDVAGAVGLVHAAEGFPSSLRLVLDGVRPAVARVLDRCGAPFAAQLGIVARPSAATAEA